MDSITGVARNFDWGG